MNLLSCAQVEPVSNLKWA